MPLSQETITILMVGVSLASIILVTQGDMRAEVRDDREKMRAEARADREVFARQITRLVEHVLAGAMIVLSPRAAPSPR